MSGWDGGTAISPSGVIYLPHAVFRNPHTVSGAGRGDCDGKPLPLPQAEKNFPGASWAAHRLGGRACQPGGPQGLGLGRKMALRWGRGSRVTFHPDLFST